MSDKKNKTRSLKKKLFSLISVVYIPLTVLCIFSVLIMGTYNLRYRSTLINATTLAEFNNDFKSNVDLQMYYYVVGAYSDSTKMPLKDVADAREIITRLSKTTTISENKWRIKSLLNLCNNLEKNMLDISHERSYSVQMEMLENNVYGITELMDDYMHDYIYYEVAHLTDLHRAISAQMLVSMGLFVAAAAALIIVQFRYITNFLKSMTDPIYSLREKVSIVGKGRFDTEPIVTDIVEFNELDGGVDKMSGRIKSLLDNVQHNSEQLRKAEMELLQAQINPHFLYNTLDSIVWMAEAGDRAGVIKMTTSLSTFFRTSLSDGEDIIPLETEFRQVESYLEIQKQRYKDILDYSVELDPTAGSYMIPKLTLQPLVENALYHGIKNKRGGGIIKISGKDCGDTIRLSVEDNGIGMDSGTLEKLRNGMTEDHHNGLGVVNVYRRLKLCAGNDSDISFESEQGKGTLVTVTLSKTETADKS